MATTVIIVIEHGNFRDQFRLMVRGGTGPGWELQGGRFEDYDKAVLVAKEVKACLKDNPIMVLGEE